MIIQGNSTTTMWKNRYQRFIRGVREIKGIAARSRYILWCGRRCMNFFFSYLASKTNCSPNATATLSNIAIPVSIDKANMLGYMYGNRLKLAIVNRNNCINFVIPTIAPAIIYGGYISYFNLAARLISQGHVIRFIVTDSRSLPKNKLLEMLQGHPTICYVLQNAEILHAIAQENYVPISVSSNDTFVAYSAFTALLCHHATKEIGKEKFIFYIQEEEGHFHANNSFKAMVEYIYTLPHLAIFNSYMLENYFRMFKLGVFQLEASEKITNHLTFKHSLSNRRLPTKNEIANRTQKKLLFFARPEQHAERNLFEIGLIALRICCYQGIFDKEKWEFHAIGAMTSGFSLELANGHFLKFLPRQSITEYAELLLNYDLGLSLMYAPHPSVPNFEMAAAGMPTVTTTFINRSRAEMEEICPNLIAAHPHIEGVVAGIKEALIKVSQYDDRIKNAKFDWPRTWEETFSDDWLNQFKQLLSVNNTQSEDKTIITYATT